MTATTMPYFTSGKFGTGPKPGGWNGDWETSTPPGYTLTDALGVGSSPVIVLYSQDDSEADGPGWLVAVSDSSVTEYIGANLLRDVLDLQARWAPVAVASVLSYLFEIVAGPDEDMGSLGALPWLLGRIRADETEGVVDQAESEILASRRERRKAWMAAQAAPAPGSTGDAADEVRDPDTSPASSPS